VCIVSKSLFLCSNDNVFLCVSCLLCKHFTFCITHNSLFNMVVNCYIIICIYVSYLLVSFANTSVKYLKQYVHYLILALCMCPLLTFHVIVVAVWIHERQGNH